MESTAQASRRPWLLLVNVFAVATCGIVYELLAGTIATYILGDSVTQFSLVIGLYLSALGLGAWLSKFLSVRLERRFVEVELAVALLGGISAPLLFFCFPYVDRFDVLLYGIVVAVGTFVGLEIPLLMRILRDKVAFRELVSRVLSFDYLGALAASVAFPLFFVPRLGLVRTSLVFGMVNAGVALWSTWLLAPHLPNVKGLRIAGLTVLTILTTGLGLSESMTLWMEEKIAGAPILYATSSPYQRIVFTKNQQGLALFLNGHLQFAESDEHRYHEALVHPALARVTTPPARVLVLGGGDGLAVREILRWPSVREVVLVDLDPEVTRMGRELPELVRLNGGALLDSRVHVIAADAMLWLAEGTDRFDAAIVDFPDPSRYEVSKLYTRSFYRRLAGRLEPDAVVSIQCTSPFVARRSFWCVVATLEAAGFAVSPYHCTVPSFGVWGFALASPSPIGAAASMPEGLRFLDSATHAAMFDWPADMSRVSAAVNRLDDQVLVRYYTEEWSKLQ